MDEDEIKKELGIIEPLTDAISTGDVRKSLVALRDYVAHELEGNRCNTCQMSKLRTGDTAALVLRLQKIIEDLQALGPEIDMDAEKAAGVISLASIRARRDSSGGPVPEVSNDSRLGVKSSPRRQSGRQPRFRSD